ncbi:hypothetical protein LWC35_07605 [Pseudonocardia kujensis]|nr:hypothetical protein [Pseudonocardia kujensis]MCE0762776.1 hypothetical protein [Pseudonocardia kujensis]
MTSTENTQTRSTIAPYDRWAPFMSSAISVDPPTAMSAPRTTKNLRRPIRWAITPEPM